MNKLFSTICFTAAAAISGTVVYLYMNDRDVKDKVDTAISSVVNAAVEIKSSLDKRRIQKEQEAKDSLEKNRAWVDEQWEAIGI